MSSFVPERPTLPPLRSLALPMHGVPSKLTLPAVQSDPHAHQRRRQECVSSPTYSQFPPPPPSIAGPPASTLYNSTSTYPQYVHQANSPEPHVRLVLTDSFETADAALVLCRQPGAPLLVVGPAFERIRRPGTDAPYRIVHPTSAPPRSSVTSSTHYATRPRK
ncbi:hypothetical protein BJV77DRAFT_994307 [Russula vinacea]|nr:hypothetical protein BJV77DRAFT_994307 [Russula vinacea]